MLRRSDHRTSPPPGAHLTSKPTRATSSSSDKWNRLQGPMPRAPAQWQSNGFETLNLVSILRLLRKLQINSVPHAKVSEFCFGELHELGRAGKPTLPRH